MAAPAERLSSGGVQGVVGHFLSTTLKFLCDTLYKPGDDACNDDDTYHEFRFATQRRAIGCEDVDLERFLMAVFCSIQHQFPDVTFVATPYTDGVTSMQYDDDTTSVSTAIVPGTPVATQYINNMDASDIDSKIIDLKMRCWPYSLARIRGHPTDLGIVSVGPYCTKDTYSLDNDVLHISLESLADATLSSQANIMLLIAALNVVIMLLTCDIVDVRVRSRLEQAFDTWLTMPWNASATPHAPFMKFQCDFFFNKQPVIVFGVGVLLNNDARETQRLNSARQYVRILMHEASSQDLVRKSFYFPFTTAAGRRRTYTSVEDPAQLRTRRHDIHRRTARLVSCLYRLQDSEPGEESEEVHCILNELNSIAQV